MPALYSAQLKHILPLQVKSSVHYQINNQTKFINKRDIVYLGTCPKYNCLDIYIGKNARRISERIINHNCRDQKVNIFKYSFEKRHQQFQTNDFKIIGNGFTNNSFSVVLLIKQTKSLLNVQEKSIEQYSLLFTLLCCSQIVDFE